MSYPALEVLFGAYLNEDALDDYPDVDSAIRDFAVEHSDLAEAVQREVEDLLARNPVDDALELETLRLGLAVSGGYTNHREWLTQIADRVRATTT